MRDRTGQDNTRHRQIQIFDSPFQPQGKSPSPVSSASHTSVPSIYQTCPRDRLHILYQLSSLEFETEPQLFFTTNETFARSNVKISLALQFLDESPYSIPQPDRRAQNTSLISRTIANIYVSFSSASCITKRNSIIRSESV